jgi:hypothetical protein
MDAGLLRLLEERSVGYDTIGSDTFLSRGVQRQKEFLHGTLYIGGGLPIDSS